MSLGAAALRFVLGQGLPALIEVSGRSMEPTIGLGAKVHVAALAPDAPLAAGDVVLVATSGDVVLLHRVLAAFDEGDARFVVHQGDAAASTFAIAARAEVLGLMTSFADDGRPPPTPERLDAAARARFHRRARAAAPFLAVRRLARALGVGDGLVVRRCAQLYRDIARRLVG
jgi:hypothetical protein